MNCKRFRYQLSVDPFSNDDALRRHSAGCVDCAQRQRRAQAFEEQLRTALSAEWEETVVEQHRVAIAPVAARLARALGWRSDR